MAHAALHEEEDDAFGTRRKVRQARRERVYGGTGTLAGHPGEGERSEATGERLQRVAAGEDRVVHGSLLGLQFDEVDEGTQRTVHTLWAGKGFCDVRLQHNDIAARPIAAGVFAARAPAEIIFRAGLAGGGWLKGLLHIVAFRDGWLFGH